MKIGKQTFDFSSFIFLLSIYIAFFASGASCLFAEVTWNRMLIVIVGNSLSATAMILVVFMGGLGLGSYTAGKLIGNRRPSLVPYLLLEAAIGVYILLSPILFRVLSHTFSAMAGSDADRISLTFIRIMVSLAALFLPAFLMGATFPAMISGAMPDLSAKRTARIGFLYSINTLGAAVGCFIAGYHLLFEFGVQTTLVCAFCLNILAALCALVANSVNKSIPEEAAAATHPSDSADVPVDAALWRFLRFATFGIGFVALAYEVVLTRLGILYLGNTTKVFSLVLTAFLLGTGISAVLGTWLYGFLRRHTKHSDKLFGFTAIAAGVLVVATPFALLSSGGGTWVTASPGAPYNPLPHLLIMIGPTIFIGALLPVAMRILQPAGRGESTQEAATLYAINTMGGLLGAGLINHLFVPLIGLQWILILLASICVLVGAISLVSPSRSLPRWSIVFLSVVVFAASLSMSLPGIMGMYAAKVAKSTTASNVETLLLHEGRAATVTVLDVSTPGINTYRDMFLNGVEEASTRIWHAQIFKLLGSLPVLLHESNKPMDALVIAFGAGMSAGSALVTAQVASLDVVDLNPDIEGINNLFRDANGDVFHQSRFHFHNDDGRNYLVTCGKQYDLIISDSTHPRSYDSWILYTQEFYRDVKRRLRPDGIFAQWVPVDPGMWGELFQIHLNTFRSVFPHATLWHSYGSSQAFLLATPEPFRLDARSMQQKLDRLPAWFQAHGYQIDTVTRLAGFFWLDEEKMAEMIGGETRVNTDNVHYFDKQSANWPVPPQRRLPAFQANILPYVTNADKNLRAGIRNEQHVAQLLTDYWFKFDDRYLLAAYCLMPQNAKVRYAMAIEFPKGLPNLDCR